jgi:hypothetical protein
MPYFIEQHWAGEQKLNFTLLFLEIKPSVVITEP